MIIAYYALHYGSDYLGYSIKSIYDTVDEIHILYTDRPSHGHSSPLQNPDSREKLKASSLIFGDPQNKIKWHEGHWGGEGQQRDTIFSLVPQADTVLVVDADEIWYPDVLANALKEGREGGARNNLIRMQTFWRSFRWTCSDEMMPVRLIFPHRPGNSIKYLNGRVMHFGYARSIADIEYKISCHGHKGEWRNEWLDKYRNWPASGNNDLHPTCHNTWNAQPFDKTTLPDYLKTHPYYSMDVIP